MSRKKLILTQRKVLRMITRDYSTVPADAVQALCGQMPLNLEFWEKVAVYCIRKGKDVYIPDLVVPATDSMSPGVKINDERFKAYAREVVPNAQVRSQ